MKHVLTALLLTATAAGAQDFAEGSEANSWGLIGEEKAFFEARVVDLACELTGDCPEDCGAGARQLGLVRAADDQLVMVLKNGQPVFSGAVVDLLPFCGMDVEVDGLLVNEEDWTGIATKFYQVQRIRELPDGEWTRANRFTTAWEEEFPDAAGEGPWFRRDPRINALIERDGYLGLGQEADAAFIEDWF
ncbi:hypothetical protein [Pontivivens ytuae]|uniref:Uncharacterized protein n=1 Tax=Pontivivens ytuae TaxID=2789856 RepID=A0A7S9QCU3_9RHOB|nr:hypothetical protein [Pontivivens ytuae]QPH54588.1 hypothetical protein I0K15_02055 [Pontivivens ytuae]